MEDKLLLISLANEFDVSKEVYSNGNTFYVISLKDPYGDDYEDSYYSLKCELEFNDHSHLISENYYVTGAYNSGVESLLVNMDALNKLRQFVKLLSEEK